MEALPGLASEPTEQADVDLVDELAYRARSDAEAFGELYRHHRSSVFRDLLDSW
jgi:hypothetical protein